MTRDNQIINSLWIGSQLKNLELLTLKSFVAHQHIFHLWIYEPLDNKIPEGIILKDANQIIPQDKVFRYKNGEKSGLGKNSLGGFSDIFRYKLLYEKGGWWVDMDVTCLKPFLFKTPYVFRTHDFLAVVGNIMKCPPKSELMKACYEEAVATIDEENKEWLKPVKILNKYISYFQLQSYIYPNISNPDRWELIVLYKYSERKVSSKWYAIHWINEEWRKRGFDKNKAFETSEYYQLLKKYQLPVEMQSSVSFFRSAKLIFRANVISLLPNSVRLLLKKLT